MTASEMNYELEIRLRGLPDAAKQMFITLDRNKYLNEAQTEFFLAAYRTFDRTELEKKVLSKLVEHFQSTTFTQSSIDLPNGYIVNLPNTLEFVLEEFVQYVGDNTIVQVFPIKYNYYVSNIDNPFKQPYEEMVWRLDINNNHEIITDGVHNLAKYVARYLRKPVDIDINNGVDCEINSLYHQTIVNSAASRITAVVLALMQTQQRNQKQPKNQEENV